MEKHRLLLCSSAILSFGALSTAHAGQADAPQGIEAPSAYLESIENPGNVGGVEDAAAAPAVEAQEADDDRKAEESKKD